MIDFAKALEWARATIDAKVEASDLTPLHGFPYFSEVRSPTHCNEQFITNCYVRILFA